LNKNSGGPLTTYAWEDLVKNENIFGNGTAGEYGAGMLWKVEGFFMINQYHMALINDNDFGLDGNTHVQIAIVQLDAKSMIGLDPCMSASLSCSTDAFPIPTKCSVSGNVPATYKAPPPETFGSQPFQDAEIGVYVIVGVFACAAVLFMCKPYIFDGKKLNMYSFSPDAKPSIPVPVNTKSIEEGEVKPAMPEPMPAHSFSTMPMAPIVPVGTGGLHPAQQYSGFDTYMQQQQPGIGYPPRY
jgi:hypothetical protein